MLNIDLCLPRTICELADLHKAKALAVACAKFMLTKEEEMELQQQ